MKKNMILLCAIFIGLGLYAQEFKGDFTKIDASFIYDIELVKGDDCSVRVDCPEELQEYLQVQIQDGTLKLSNRKNEFQRKKGMHKLVMKVYVTMPTLEQLDMSGASKLMSKGKFMLKDLELSLSGASVVKGLNVKCENAELYVSGASKIGGLTLDCKSDLVIDLSGASRIYHSKFSYVFANLDLSGSSHISADMDVDNLINIDLSGASVLEIKGSANEMNLDMNGASKFMGPEFVVQKGTADLSGASRARTNVKGSFRIEKSGASGHRNGEPTKERSSDDRREHHDWDSSDRRSQNIEYDIPNDFRYENTNYKGRNISQNNSFLNEMEIKDIIWESCSLKI